MLLCLAVSVLLFSLFFWFCLLNFNKQLSSAELYRVHLNVIDLLFHFGWGWGVTRTPELWAISNHHGLTIS